MPIGRLRRAASKPRPHRPRIIIAQVEGSGTALLTLNESNEATEASETPSQGCRSVNRPISV